MNLHRIAKILESENFNGFIYKEGFAILCSAVPAAVSFEALLCKIINLLIPPEIRANLLYSLKKVLLWKQEIHLNILEAIEISLNDYTIDSRGDVGSWVRKAAMSVGFDCLTHFPGNIHRGEFYESYLGFLLLHSVDKLDKLRKTAHKYICKLNESKILLFDPIFEPVLQYETLYLRQDCWDSQFEGFYKFAKLLQLEKYQKFLLFGFISSCGGLGGSVVFSL
jgi:hypothetical protein